MIYIKVDAKYIEGLDAEADVVEWPARAAVAGPPVIVPPEPPVDACAAAKSALLNYKYDKGKSRIKEVRLACHASPMTDDASRPCMGNPMFEAIFAAAEESEKKWKWVSELEHSVQNRFGRINNKTSHDTECQL